LRSIVEETIAVVIEIAEIAPLTTPAMSSLSIAINVVY